MAINISIVCAILLSLEKFTNIYTIKIFDVSAVVVYMFMSAFTCLFFYLKIHKNLQEKFENCFKYCFLGSLSLILFVALKVPYLQSFGGYALELNLLAIGFGFFSFYFNADKINEIELDNSEEKAMEEKRKEEFPAKFQRLNKIPVLRGIVRWMYKEGWGYSAGLILVLLISFSFIYSPYLGSFMTVDEHRWIYTPSNPELVLPTSYEKAMSREYNSKSYQRSIGYWNAYFSGNFKATFNNPNPSATINFLHLPAYLIKNQVSFSTYLTVGRLTIILHNLLIIFIIYYLAKYTLSKKQALLLAASIALYPLIIGFSRVINHDSIQGLYVVGTLLSLYGSLKFNKKILYKTTGIFLGLAIMTQFKTQFLVPLLFLYPIIHAYIKKNPLILKSYVNKLGTIYLYALITTVIVLPAVIFYPQIIIDRFFFYSKTSVLLITIVSLALFLLSFLHPEKTKQIYKKIAKYETPLIRFVIIGIVALLGYSILQQNYVFDTIFYLNKIPNYSDALISTLTVFFFSVPAAILFILISMIAWIFFKKPKLTFSSFLIIAFFLLLILSVFATYGTHPKNGTGYYTLDFKYLTVFIPFLLLSIFSSALFRKLSIKTFVGLFGILVITLIYGNYSAKPMYAYYNNIFLPKGRFISATTFAFDTIATVPYVNKYTPLNTHIYNPRGQMEDIVRPDITMIPWYSKFWEANPDYIILEWEKKHQWTAIFDYYRKNKEPIWALKQNGIIYTGLYEFDPTLNYEEILQ